jgi:DNA-binding transcriptional MerR regulator
VSEGESQALYSIGAVARMLDVPTSTLRAWEERYGIVTPERSHGSQRLYSRSQIESLRFIKAQIDSGVSAADAHRILSQAVRAGRLPVSAPVSAAAARDRRPLIMIAERDPYAADLAEYFLRTEGYEVCLALDARQAILLFEERSPELVVLDLLISGGAGFRLCGEFASKAGALVVAVASIDAAHEALRAGAAAFLQKPVESLALVSTIRDLIGTSALSRDSVRTQTRP